MLLALLPQLIAVGTLVGTHEGSVPKICKLKKGDFMAGIKSRTFALELYPEDSSHMDILEYIIQHFEYAFILHDKDVYEEDRVDVETGEIVAKKGELKKPHYHVIIAFKNARYEKKVKEELGIAHIEKCDFYAYTRYLIHMDNPKKYQYKPEDIQSNMRLRIDNALKREYDKKEQDSRILLDFILSRNFVTFRQVVDFAIENDCLSELKKSTYMYKSLCDETGFRRV